MQKALNFNTVTLTLLLIITRLSDMSHTDFELPVGRGNMEESILDWSFVFSVYFLQPLSLVTTLICVCICI